MLPCDGYSQVRWRVIGWSVAVVMVMCAARGSVRADVASDRAAAILVFPKIVVDTTATQISPPARIDTLIRVSNTSKRPIRMKCFYVNATPHCKDGGTGSCWVSPPTCSTACETNWQESDFFVTLTARQPIGWVASLGLAPCRSGDTSKRQCLPLQANEDSLIQPVPEDPFVGELKCIAVDANAVPIDRNDLKGEVEIIRSTAGSVDVEAYNAIGIQAIPGANDGDEKLVLGGVCQGGPKQGQPCAGAAACLGGTCPAEYNSCPNILILDHFFDGALDPVSGKLIFTDLTLVPCSEDFATQVPLTTTVHFLVFNEFEQRFSTSRPVTCFQEWRISTIDRATPSRSIFSAAVMGTLTGQTRIRGFADEPQLGETPHGHTLLGIAEEFRMGGGTAAVNLHFQGIRPQSDFIFLPPAP